MKKKKWIKIEEKIGKVPSTKTIAITPRKNDTKSLNIQSELVPKTKSDLAVHVKKVKDVESWLEKSLSSNNILLLTGPTGCGKTATVRVLCKELNVEIIEWINPVDQEFEFGGQSQLGRFLDFFSQSKYCSLLVDYTVSKQVVLVEDFPNFLLNRPEDFISVLEKCYCNRNPTIFICTDVQNTQLNLNRNLFPDNVKEKFQIDTISFNATSATLLRSLLKKAQEITLKYPDTFQSPSEDVIDAIICSAAGDIRAALNQFHFASLKGLKELPVNLNLDATKGTKRKRKSTSSTVKFMEKDKNLGLFHGLGRVLNPKRGENGKIMCNFDQLIDQFSTQPNTINDFLFENYLQYFGDLQDVDRSAEILSQTQLLLNRWSERHENVQISLWYLILGLMVNNEHRISKWNQIVAPKRVEKKDGMALRSKGLEKTDCCYYNFITKSDTFKILQ